MANIEIYHLYTLYTGNTQGISEYYSALNVPGVKINIFGPSVIPTNTLYYNKEALTHYHIV
jgi:hypothetical protein